MQHNGTLYRLFGLVAHMTKDPVQKPDPYSDWVILGSKHGHDKPSYPIDEELLAAAREAWPHVLAHARRELSDKDVGADKTALAAEVWERVLRSVSRTRQRRRDQAPPIADLQSYLMGVFHHRFNRVLKREQKRLETIELVSSTSDLGSSHHPWNSGGNLTANPISVYGREPECLP